MASQHDIVTIKKYANRRLYNTGTSCYVTLEDLAVMVKKGEDFTVKDAKTGEDITRPVLTQIIFDAENKGQSLLPTTFLRQLIRFYGDSMQTLVPPFLEHSISNFTRDQEKMRTQMTGGFGSSAIEAMEEQARRNVELFEQSMRMFMPFGGEIPSALRSGDDDSEREEDLQHLRQQVAAMQARIDQLEGEEAKDSAADAAAKPTPDAPAVVAKKVPEPVKKAPASAKQASTPQKKAAEAAKARPAAAKKAQATRKKPAAAAKKPPAVSEEPATAETKPEAADSKAAPAAKKSARAAKKTPAPATTKSPPAATKPAPAATGSAPAAKKAPARNAAKAPAAAPEAEPVAPTPAPATQSRPARKSRQRRVSRRKTV